jgi:hypothetical protein
MSLRRSGSGVLIPARYAESVVFEGDTGASLPRKWRARKRQSLVESLSALKGLLYGGHLTPASTRCPVEAEVQPVRIVQARRYDRLALLQRCNQWPYSEIPALVSAHASASTTRD